MSQGEVKNKELPKERVLRKGKELLRKMRQPRTQDKMPTVNELSRTRVTSGTDERPFTRPPSTEDKMPSVPATKRKRRSV